MYDSNAFWPISGNAQPEYHDSGIAIRSSSTRFWRDGSGVGRARRLAEDGHLVADGVVLLLLLGDVVAVVLDDELDLPTGDAALLVHVVPEHPLRFDDLG